MAKAINRRGFITVAAGAVALGGCSSLGLAAKKPEPDFIWSYLAHFGGLVKFCDAYCSKDRLKGYMMTTWLFTLEKYEARALEAIAQMEPVIKARKK